MTARWAILTGEYPPQPGGVADYTRQVATNLTAAGDAVRVFAPPLNGESEADSLGVAVTRLPDHFGPRGLLELDRIIARLKPDRVLIQYVPHAFGFKAMNLPFAAWVATRLRRLAPVWVMFHEVAFPFRWRPPTHAMLAVAHRAMGRWIAGAAERVFVSTTSWEPIIRRLCGRAITSEWLPIPSNIPYDLPGEVNRSNSGMRIGHFGTYGPATADLLSPVLARLLNGAENRTALLMGRGGSAFRDRFALQNPTLAHRMVATGDLSDRDVAARLRGCDVLVQPYIDGISTRRTSAMAGLANGVPVVSNLGELSEPLWSGRATTTSDPAVLASAADAILALPFAQRLELGRKAAAFYRDTFAIDRTIARLRDPDWRASR